MLQRTEREAGAGAWRVRDLGIVSPHLEAESDSRGLQSDYLELPGGAVSHLQGLHTQGGRVHWCSRLAFEPLGYWLPRFPLLLQMINLNRLRSKPY